MLHIIPIEDFKVFKNTANEHHTVSTIYALIDGLCYVQSEVEEHSCRGYVTPMGHVGEKINYVQLDVTNGVIGNTVTYLHHV